MRNLIVLFFFVWLSSLHLFGQSKYSSVFDIKDEWSDYTNFQRDEMVSFCDFLYKEKHFERFLLTAFQFLYRFPDDSLKTVMLYNIARSYEEIKNYDLANRYYDRIINSEQEYSIPYRASKIRSVYTYLIDDKIKKVYSMTSETDDPYLMVLRGYAFLKELKWEKARATFIAADSKFNHLHYSELIAPIFQSIENVQSVRTHNKYLVGIGGLFMPGGGQFILKDINNGQGIFATAGFFLLAARWSKTDALSGSNRYLNHQSLNVPVFQGFEASGSNKIELRGKDNLPVDINHNSSYLNYVIPPIFLGLGVYLGGFWKSYLDTKKTNRSLFLNYIDHQIIVNSPLEFFDFSEPYIIIKN
tara:strand:+ start:724 stop:1797 length:1074 start_codon:yes stop_codon:yes gene_type:complete